MTDLYIATSTQADYNALMRLAEAAGYEWYSGGAKPTALNLYYEYVKNGGQVIHFGVESKALMQCGREYFEKMGATIETIPNLANIKTIWKVSRENREIGDGEMREIKFRAWVRRLDKQKLISLACKISNGKR